MNRLELLFKSVTCNQLAESDPDNETTLGLLRDVQSILEKGDGLARLALDDAVKAVLPSLTSSSDHQRAAALRIIGRLRLTSGGNGSVSDDSLLLLLARFLWDGSHRVCQSACEMLTMLAKAPTPLRITQLVYGKIMQQTIHANPHVRIAALEALLAAVRQDPAAQANVKGAPEGASITEHAFTVFCKRMFDSDVTVQVAACTFLASLTHASEALILQTMSKKAINEHLLPPSRFKGKTLRLHKRRRGSPVDPGQTAGLEKTLSPLESTGDQDDPAADDSAADDALEPSPNDETDAEKARPGAPLVAQASGDIALNASVLSVDAMSFCGALIEALESEFESMRLAAVKTLGRLCAQCSSMGAWQRALPFLCEMFHDEMVPVRTAAIRTVRQLLARFPSTVVESPEAAADLLVVLLERHAPTRAQALRMLAHVRFAALELLLHTRHELLLCCQRHPEDTARVLMCLRALGVAHAPLLASQVSTMLGTDPRYVATEIDVDSLAHVANLALLFGASEANAAILGAMPQYAFRQVEYLRDRWAGGFGPLNLGVSVPSDMQEDHARLDITVVSRALAAALEDGHSLNDALVEHARDMELLDLRDCEREWLPFLRCVAVGAAILAHQRLDNAETTLDAEQFAVTAAAAVLQTVEGGHSVLDTRDMTAVAAFACGAGLWHCGSDKTAIVALAQWCRSRVSALGRCSVLLESLAALESLASPTEQRAALGAALVAARAEISAFAQRVSTQSDPPRLLTARVTSPRSYASALFERVLSNRDPTVQTAADDSDDSDPSNDNPSASEPVLDTGSTYSFCGGYVAPVRFSAVLEGVPADATAGKLAESIVVVVAGPTAVPRVVRLQPFQFHVRPQRLEATLATTIWLDESPTSADFDVSLTVCRRLQLPAGKALDWLSGDTTVNALLKLGYYPLGSPERPRRISDRFRAVALGVGLDCSDADVQSDSCTVQLSVWPRPQPVCAPPSE